MNQEVYRFNKQEQCIAALADLICSKASESYQARGIFTLVLSGGLTPIELYESLATEKFMDKLKWDRTHLFWGDERFVHVDDPENNYTMVQLAMISQVPIPLQNVHRIRTETVDAEEAARDYESHLREFAAREPRSMGSGKFPKFDLVLLGLGVGGHTASLFAGRSELAESSRWVVASEAPPEQSPKDRITMTFPVFNNARCVAFLFYGKEKNAMLDQIIRTPDEAAKIYPAARVRPAGDLLWFVA